MIPAMERKGYDRAFSGAVTVSAGLLGPIIPPSMLMIIYGVLAEQSIGRMFLAGIIPGLLLAAGFAPIYRERSLDAPELAPARAAIMRPTGVEPVNEMPFT